MAVDIFQVIKYNKKRLEELQKFAKRDGYLDVVREREFDSIIRETERMNRAIASGDVRLPPEILRMHEESLSRISQIKSEPIAVKKAEKIQAAEKQAVKKEPVKKLPSPQLPKNQEEKAREISEKHNIPLSKAQQIVANSQKAITEAQERINQLNEEKKREREIERKEILRKKRILRVK